MCKLNVIIAVFTVFIEVIGRVACRREHRKILDAEHYHSAGFAVLSLKALTFVFRLSLAVRLCFLYIFFKRLNRLLLQFGVYCKKNGVAGLRINCFNSVNNRTVGVFSDYFCSAYSLKLLLKRLFNTEFTNAVRKRILLFALAEFFVFLLGNRTERTENMRRERGVFGAAHKVGLNLNSAYPLGVFAYGVHCVSAYVVGKGIWLGV